MRWKPQNLGWKLGSILLAALLWVAFSAQPDVATIRAVPVLFRNLSKDLVLTGDIPETVHVELRGPEGRLTSSNMADAVAVFDLSHVSQPGTQTFTIATSDLNLPAGVTFLRAVPSQLQLEFARLKSKEVPVELRLTGTLPEGLRLTSRRLTPEMLRIAGSEAGVDNISSVQTDPIDLATITGPTTLRVNAFVPQRQTHFETSPVVTVELDVERTEIKK